jgi:hypothetical protein
MIADVASHLDLPASEVLRKLSYGELYHVIDLEDWLRPYYYDPKNHKWYFDSDEVSCYIELINALNKTYRANKANEAVGSNQAA